MEIGVQRTARPTQIGARSRVQVGRVTPCADQGPQTIDYVYR